MNLSPFFWQEGLPGGPLLTAVKQPAFLNFNSNDQLFTALKIPFDFLLIHS